MCLVLLLLDKISVLKHPSIATRSIQSRMDLSGDGALINAAGVVVNDNVLKITDFDGSSYCTVRLHYDALPNVSFGIRISSMA